MTPYTPERAYIPKYGIRNVIIVLQPGKYLELQKVKNEKLLTHLSNMEYIISLKIFIMGDYFYPSLLRKFI